LRKRFVMKLRALFLLLPLAASLVACVHEPDQYIATNGTKSGPEGARDALLASARHDLACAEDIRDYELSLGTTYGGGRYPQAHRHSVQVAEGCGKRAVYKAACDSEVVVPPGATKEEARRLREWSVDSRDPTIVCRYVLLSRVTLDGTATDSVAGDLSQLP